MRILGALVFLAGLGAIVGGAWLRDAFAPMFIFPLALLAIPGLVLCLIGAALIVYGGES